MSSPFLHRWKAGWLLPCAILLGLSAPAGADPKPLSKEEQAKVDKVIERAVDYLKRTQTDEGDWPKLLPIWRDRYPAGQCLLPAYALLEAGVPANDPVIQKAARYIRLIILKSEETYELSLGALFFDRLGDPKDKKLIQTLALRLIAGQHRTGGWNYRCPTLKAKDETALIKLLGELDKAPKTGEKPTGAILKTLHVPADLRPLTIFQDPRKFKWHEPPSTERTTHYTLFVGRTDNSNTQFAMLGLWAAQRHGIPTRPTFRLMVERFEKMQETNGGWPYTFTFGRHAAGLSRSMICVGLLGLAIGHGLDLPGSEDIRVLKGLAALYQEIGRPTSQMDKLVPHEDVYFLWSLERVAMLFNLPTIGDKEWYRWGAEILVTNQKRDGEWAGAPLMMAKGGMSDYGPPLNTAFALLFLKRSHPMRELTPKLPFTAKELNQGIARLRSGDKDSLERSLSGSRSGRKPDH